MKVNITLTTPAELTNGQPLTDLAGIKLIRGDEVINYPCTTPGVQITIEDLLPYPMSCAYQIFAYTDTYDGMQFHTGNYDVGEYNGIVIWTLDQTPISEAYFSQFLSEFNYDKQIFLTDIVNIPLDTTTDVLFVTLGINPNNYELSQDEANIIVNYLQSGGNVYMEGGDCWYADPNAGMYASYFGVNPLTDGGSVTEPFVGVFFTFTYGMSFEYNGENNSLDRIQPNHTDAHTIFRNANYPYAVIFEPGPYYSIASSFEFGGLVDDEFPSTKKELFRRYMEFFEVPLIGTNTQLLDFSTNIDELELTLYNNGGGTLEWEVETGASWLTVSSYSGTITDSIAISVFVDRTGLPAGSYQSQLNFTCETGDEQVEVYMSVPTTIDDYITPSVYRISQNYPNPFNPSRAGHSPKTSIRYQIPERTKVEINIYNLCGQKVKTLVNDVTESGCHNVIWYGKDDNDNEVPSGIYFYRIKTDNFTETKKMLLLH